MTYSFLFNSDEQKIFYFCEDCKEKPLYKHFYQEFMTFQEIQREIDGFSVPKNNPINMVSFSSFKMDTTKCCEHFLEYFNQNPHEFI